jgi:Protein of unknown function (DUF3267).
MKKYFRFEMDLKFLNIFAIILFFVCFGILYIFKYDLWNNMYNMNIFIYMLILFMLHEIIHGIGFALLGKKDLKKIVFGIELEKGIFYCMCKQKISKANILLALILPLIVLGFILLAVGIIINSYILMFLAVVNISGAAGDIVMTIAIFKMRNIEYLDTDDTTGFYILSENNMSDKKYLGLKIIEEGIYKENEIIAKDYTRIKITKKSWSILIGIIVLTILLNII